MISASAGVSFNVGMKVWDQRIVNSGFANRQAGAWPSEQEKRGEVDPKRGPLYLTELTSGASP